MRHSITPAPINKRGIHPLERVKRMAREAAREEFRRELAELEPEKKAVQVPLPPHIERIPTCEARKMQRK